MLNKMQQLSVYIYQWVTETIDYTEGTVFRAWGRTRDDKKVCIHISDFEPAIYIEPDVNIRSTLTNILKEKVREATHITSINLPKLYYADIAQDGTRRTHSMARCSFKTNTDFRFIASAFERRRVPSMDMDMPAKYLVHETDVPPLLQFLCERGLKQVGWHNFIGFMRTDATRDTVADIEFDCLWTGCSIGESAPPPQLEIWGFDIEAYTSVPSRMPRADVPLDCIFQISLL